MRRKVYVVWIGEWDSTQIESIWSTKQAAEARIGKMPGVPASVEAYDVHQGHEVDSLPIKETPL